MKVELRVAKVLEAEAVPKSKKLVKLNVDVGTEQRTIVAGIAEAYPPEQLVGRTIVIVANLKPAKLMGIESNGMVLAASPEGGLPNAGRGRSTLPPAHGSGEARRGSQARAEIAPPRARSREPTVVLVDSHCHIAGPEFAGDLDAVIARAPRWPDCSGRW